MMREMRCFWFIAALFMVANFAFAQREFRSASRFEPPVENFRANISLETIADLLERKDFNQAAAQVESLLKSNADEITSGDERSLISISNWIDSLSRLHGKEVTAVYRERFDAGAKGALDELRRDST